MRRAPLTALQLLGSTRSQHDPSAPRRCKFVAMMPQWDLLDFVLGQARKFPAFDAQAAQVAIENRLSTCSRTTIRRGSSYWSKTE
jgi:hypothetical protein